MALGTMPLNVPCNFATPRDMNVVATVQTRLKHGIVGIAINSPARCSNTGRMACRLQCAAAVHFREAPGSINRGAVYQHLAIFAKHHAPTSPGAQAQRCRMLAGCFMCSKSSVCNVFPQRTFFRQQLCPASNNLRKVGPGLGPTLRNGRRPGPAKSKTSPKAGTSVCAGPAWHVLALCGQRLLGRPQKACFTSGGPRVLSQGLAQQAGLYARGGQRGA